MTLRAMQRGRICLMAAAAACATIVIVSQMDFGAVELLDRHSGIKPLTTSANADQSRGGEFAKVDDSDFDWDGWLRKVTLQVKAAVDLASDGLNGANKRQLDNILAKDVAKDAKRGEALAADLGQHYGGSTTGSASARRKAAVQAAAKTVEMQKAAPHVTEAQIKAPVALENKGGIDPFGKLLGNKVAKDDSSVEQDQMRLKIAEAKLESEERRDAGVPEPQRHAAEKANRNSKSASAENKTPKMAAARHSTHALLARMHSSTHSTHAKMPHAAGAGEKKTMQDKMQGDELQGDINLVLGAVHGDKKKAAREEKDEERDFAKELHKLGLGGAVQHKKAKVKWPSQLELPGQNRQKQKSDDSYPSSDLA